jgi:hypothetical protein
LYLSTFAVVWALILFYPIRYAAKVLEQGQAFTQAAGFFKFWGFGSLLNWPIVEYGVYWRFALLLFPALCLMIAADQTSSDRARGSLRFLVLRVSRNALFFGRFVAAMLAQLLLIIATLISAMGLAMYRDASLPIAWDSALAILVNLSLVLLPFTAMMAALSVKINSARACTVWALLICLFLAGVIRLLASYLPALELLKILVPGYQLPELAQLVAWQSLQLAYIPLLQTVLLLGLGSWIMQRQTL